MKNNKTYKMIMVAMFAALITAGAFITIPLPLVPLTMQDFFTILAGLVLGGWLGMASVLLYVFIGLVGVPIFTQGGGIGYVFKPTFGFFIGFALGTLVGGLIANKKKNPSLVRLLVANVIDLIIIYACGILYYIPLCKYHFGNTVNLGAIIKSFALAPLPGDIVKLIIAALVAYRLIPFLRKMEMNQR